MRGRARVLTHPDPGIVSRQARRFEPHRFAQDQQRHRTDLARQATRQDQDHRRDGCRSARCGHRDRLCQVRNGVHRLHGCRGRQEAGLERVQDQDAGRKGTSVGVVLSYAAQLTHALVDSSRSSPSLPVRKPSRTPSTRPCVNGSPT